MTAKSQGTRRGIGNLLIAVVLLLGFLLRLAPWGRYVTPDEPAWVHRSILFSDALAARDWAAVPSTGHPGVTTMWLGAVGASVQRVLDPVESGLHLNWIRRLAWLAPENGEAFRHLAYFLPSGRVAVALVTTLGLLIAHWLIARLFDRRVALVTAGLLAFSPFLVGHSGLLHTDALLATFSLLALLAALNGMKGPRPARWWALAGFFTGLALLTKVPAIIVFVFLLGSIAYCVLRTAYGKLRDKESQSATRNLQFAIYLLLFLTTTAATFFALYPALWADPLGVIQTLGGFAGRHVEMAQRPIFFLGQMTYDPGPIFYPVVLLIRVSPVILVGLLIGLARLRRMNADRRAVFFVLLAFAVVFGAAISMAAKQHDRYLLPALPPLALAAALALSKAKSPEVQQLFVPLFADLIKRLLPLILQLALLLPFAFYPLTYANPLLGGPWGASRVLSLDWGEGMGAAARWLNQLPQANQRTVAAVNVPSFASLFAGRTLPLNDGTISLADYAVRTVLSSGDSADSGPRWLDPAHTAALGFIDHALILSNTAGLDQAVHLEYEVRSNDLILVDADTPLVRQYLGEGTILSAASLPNEAALSEWLVELTPGVEVIWLVASPGASSITAAHLRQQLEAVATAAFTETVSAATITRFEMRSSPLTSSPAPYLAAYGGQLSLVDGVIPPTVAWPDSLRATLRWQVPAVPPADTQALVTLRDGQGRAWSSGDWLVVNGVTFPTSAWTAGEWTDSAYSLSLPPGIPPDTYTVEVALYDAATGAGLGAAGPDGAFRGTRVPLGEVAVVAPTTPPRVDELAFVQQLDRSAGPMTLFGLNLPPDQVISGDALGVSLFWQADVAPGVDHLARLRLVSSSGEVGLEEIVPLNPHPTGRWRAGDRFESYHSLHVLPDLLPGPYQLTLNVLDAQGAAIWQADQVLVAVEVLPRERSFELPEAISHPFAATFGEAVWLRGYDLDLAGAAPGGSLSLTLYWQAEGPADRPYTLFVHLLGPDGLSYGQVDWLDYAAPPSSWAPGQVIINEVVLPIAADAPSGIYHLVVGYYDAAYGTRLPVVDAAGVLLPGDQLALPIEIILGGAP